MRSPFIYLYCPSHNMEPLHGVFELARAKHALPLGTNGLACIKYFQSSKCN